MIIKRLEKYTPEVANDVRGLLIQLSRSGKDRGEIPEEWFNELINSPYHDMLLAVEDEKVIGIATVSIHMGPIIRKNVYLEDFVTDASVRGKGVGSALWDEIVKWGIEKGCNNLEFTCGQGREAAQEFYKQHGAEIYDTNFFRRALK